jgi:hypothetical protein
MTTQRTDREVAKDAERFNANIRQLKRFLRSKGIRNVHTSPKAQAAIARAAVELSTHQAETMMVRTSSGGLK